MYDRPLTVMCMPSQNNDHSRDVDRLLFEAEAHAMLGVARDELHANFVESHQAYGAKSPEIGLVDMRPLIKHFDCLGIATTWVRGGERAPDPIDAAEKQISHYPPLMQFPHIVDGPRVMQEFARLAAISRDEDMLDAIHKPVSDVFNILEGERALIAGTGCSMRNGRLVGLEHSWAVELTTWKYQDWVDILKDFNRPVPDLVDPSSDAWVFTVTMPRRHAQELVRVVTETSGNTRSY